MRNWGLVKVLTVPGVVDPLQYRFRDDWYVLLLDLDP